MTDSVLAQLAALKTTPMPELKQQWRDLFDKRAAALQPALPRKPARLSHPGTGLWRAEAGDDRAAGGAGRAARRRQHRHAAGPGSTDRPIAGTRLIREWQGVEHCVTVRDDGFEYQGRPYKSLSAVARAITGTRWNGWVFFGLKNQRGRS